MNFAHAEVATLDPTTMRTPVSYTHLDVYKRQDPLRIHQHHRGLPVAGQCGLYPHSSVRRHHSQRAGLCLASRQFQVIVVNFKHKFLLVMIY